MHKRSFVAGAVGGIVGAAILFLALFLLGVTDVTKETSVVTPTMFNSATPSTTAGMTPAQIYAKDATGVVEILSTFAAGSQSNPFFGGGTQPSQGLGSGFVVSGDGYILTNAHVVQENGVKAAQVQVTFRDGKGSATKRVPAKIVGIDANSDVALIKVDPSGLALNPLSLGDSEKTYVGEPVVAIGNPLGFDFSLTSGIVSALHRDLQSPNNGVIPNGIQTDAAINQGNSGGPLINPAGEVIGINEQIASQSGGNEGLGFAVPINTAINSMTQLKDTGTVKYPYMGVHMISVSTDIAKALNLNAQSGALVTDVQSGSPAAKAGIKGGSQQVTVQGQQITVGGDIITAIDGQEVQSADDAVAAIAKHKIGDTVKVTVVSTDGTTHTVDVTLGTRPAGL